MRVIRWLFRALLFFVVLAFALRNRQPVTLHGLMGVEWNGPLALVLWVTLLAGCLLGLGALAPSWWQQRRELRQLRAELPKPEALPSAPVPLPDVPLPEHPPRDGL